MKRKTKRKIRNYGKNALIILLILSVTFAAVLATNWTEPANFNTGLQGFYHFNDNTFADQLGNTSRNLQTNGNIKPVITGTGGGKFSRGLAFLDNSIAANTTGLTNFTNNANITIEYWWNISSGIPNQKWHFVMGSQTNYLTVYQVDTPDEICAQSTFTGAGSAVCVAANQNTKYHVALRADDAANKVSFYLNGTFAGDFDYGNPVDWNGEVFKLGVSPSNGVQNGVYTIDSLLVWNVGRSQTEIISDMGGANESIALTVTLLTPTNSSDLIKGNGLNFSARLDAGVLSNLTNATFQIWQTNGNIHTSIMNNVSGIGISNTTNLTLNMDVGNYKWNVLGCVNVSSGGSYCTAQSSNFTFRVGFKEGTQTFDSSLAEFSETTFRVNITYDDTFFDSVVGTLIYNRSSNIGSNIYTQGNNLTFSETLTTPGVNSQQSIPFYWQFQLTNSSGNSFFFNVSAQTQTVSNLAIDDCRVNTVLLINYSLKDEGTQAILNNSPVVNTSVEVDLTLRSPLNPGLNTTFAMVKNNTEPVRICVGINLTTSSYSMDVQTKYSGSAHVEEYYYIQNLTITNTTIPQNINLFDLATADSQEFLITYKDENFIVVQDALINVQRKYVSEGVSKTVEIPKTDTDGKTLAHLVLGDVVYSFSVSKNGKLLSTFPDRVVFCENQATGDCKINLNAPSGGFGNSNFEGGEDINYTLTFNQSTRVMSSTFTILSGATATIYLNATEFGNRTNNLCSTKLTSSAGTLSCTVPSSFGNGTIIGTLYREGSLLTITNKIFTIKPSSASVFGGTRIIFAILMFMSIVLIALSGGGFVTLIAGIIGIVLLGLFNIIEGGSFYGIGSTLLYLIVAAIILIYKSTTR